MERGLGCSSVVQHLPDECEGLSSNPSTKKPQYIGGQEMNVPLLWREGRVRYAISKLVKH